MNKRLFKLLSFVFLLALALPLAAKSAFAEPASTEAATGTPKAVVATITAFRVEDRFGNPTTVVNKANVYAIAMTWDASANANVEPGDYFDVALPDTMRFTAANPASTFNITDAATGEVMAVAQVTPGTDGYGGKMRVVFTDYVNNHTDLRGTARLGFTISNNRIQSGNNKTVNFTVSGRIVPVTFDLTEPGTIGTEYLLSGARLSRAMPTKFSGPVVSTTLVVTSTTSVYTTSSLTGAAEIFLQRLGMFQEPLSSGALALTSTAQPSQEPLRASLLPQVCSPFLLMDSRLILTFLA